MSTASPNVAVPRSGVLGLIERAIGWLEAVPYSLLAIPARLAVAEVFWSSFSTKIQNWDTTVTLFEDEYKLPLLSPDAAAHLTAGIEASTSILLVVGLLTRPVALLLLSMTALSKCLSFPRHGRRTFSGRRCWCSCFAGDRESCRSTTLSDGGSVSLRRRPLREAVLLRAA